MSGHYREGLRKQSYAVSHLERRKKGHRTKLSRENMKETKRGVELKQDLRIPAG